MNNNTCEIVRDIMPLVIDNAASGASCALVSEHIADCAECRKMMEDMRSDIDRHEKSEDVDEKFVALCLKVRRTLRHRKTRLRALCLALVLCLIAAGGAFVNYKITVDTKEYKPDEFALFVNPEGELMLEYGHSDLFASKGYVATLKDGICYICPVTSAWPNLMRDGGKEATIALEEYVFRDGKLVYESWETAKPILTKDREQGIYTEQYALKYDVIKEIRIGTQDDYTVAYRAGDKIPLYAMGE